MSWDRVVAPVATITIPVALVFLFFGQLWGTAASLAVLVVLWIVARPRRGPTDDDVWDTCATAAETAAGPRHGSSELALAAAEARELLLSPWFAAGAGFCILFGSLGVQSFERSWWVTAGLMPLLVHPLCGLVIVATHRNVTRARRDRTEELYLSCPTSAPQRLSGHLLTAAVPVGVSLVFVASTLLVTSVVVDGIYGPVDGRVFADVTTAALLLPVGAVALGVLLGRRLRFALAPYIVIAVIAVLDLEMWDRGLDGRGWLATGIASGGLDFIYFEPPVFGRMIWIAGLIVLVTGLTLTTADSPYTRVIVSVGVLASAVGLVMTVRPLSNETADRLTEYVMAPYEHEVCERLTNEVQVCALEPYREHGANIAAHITPVAEALSPPMVQTPITMRFLAGEHLDQLPDQVQQRLSPTPIPPGTVAMPFSFYRESVDSARFLLAATAIGLPTGESAPENFLVDGEARGVVLLWLATAGLSNNEALKLLEPDQYNDNSPSGRGDVWPSICGAPVQWAPQDVAAARALVLMNRDEVDAVIAAQWSRWVAPNTETNELLLAAGADPLGRPDAIEPLGSTC